MRVAPRGRGNRATLIPPPQLDHGGSESVVKKNFIELFLGNTFTNVYFSMVRIENRCHDDLPASHEPPCRLRNHHITPEPQR